VYSGAFSLSQELETFAANVLADDEVQRMLEDISRSVAARLRLAWVAMPGQSTVL
jgi:hypothetical protein